MGTDDRVTTIRGGVLPLPDRRAMLDASAWAAGRPGLPEAAAGWFHALPYERARAARRAHDLAQPRLWTDTVAAVARTSWRVAAAAAPEAPYALLDAGARRTGLPIRPPDRSDAVLERVEGLVRSGGPAYIKLGQFIATARGLLPDAWVDAFAWCRDRVPPLRPGRAERIIARSFRRPVDELFLDFDPEPLGSASIGQVHAAVLADGTEVVVKVRRPGLRDGFAEAIRTLALVAAGAEEAYEPARTANLRGVVELFAELVMEELDFRFEALNMVELGLVTEDAGLDARCTVPRPLPDLVTSRVLVMERLAGVPYTDAAARFGARLDGDGLLRLAVEGVLEHALVYGIFHGDLHAGNVLVDGGDRFSLVDYGIVGRLDAGQRAALVRLVVAYAQRDTAGQLAALQRFGALPDDADLGALRERFDAAAADMAEQLGVDLDDPASFAGLALADLLRGMGTSVRVLAASGFRLPRELVLFFKNLLYLNGFAEAVAPDANVVGQLDPVLAHFTAKHGPAMARLLAD